LSISILNTGLWLSEPRLVAGNMTGTSVDGIDVAFVEFSNQAGRHSYVLKAFDMFPYNHETRNLILELINGKAEAELLSSLNIILAEEYYSAIKKLSAESGIPLELIDAIGIHGQTLWHFPNPVKKSGYDIRSTYQAGSVSTLSGLAGKPVVGDFRPADIALGGQGSPLVPIFDFNFLKSDYKNRIALNIGGIANITILGKDCSEQNVIAFDTGPGNYLIDKYTKIIFDCNFDANGELAAWGNIDSELFGMLKLIPFIKQSPPKSTGRDFLPGEIELFIKNKYLKYFTTNSHSYDLIRTLTEMAAWSIAENIRLFAPGAEEIIASGGGIHNVFLIDCLQKELPTLKIINTEELGLPADAKEAVCFAYLAYRTLGGLHGNIPSVTGASRKAVLGVIASY
jgi:anhydro-N-acetylmuramic acid kinase